MNVAIARERAKALGKSRRELAEALGVKPTTLKKWFVGENQIPSQYVVPLADLLGISADTLLRGDHRRRDPVGRGAA